MKRIAVLEEWHELIVQSFVDQKLSVMQTKARLLEAGCPSFQDRKLRAYLREIGVYEQRGRGKHIAREFTCKSCQSKFTANAARACFCKRCVPDVAAQNRMSNHGISQPQYEAMLSSQAHRCAVCDRDLTNQKTAHIHVDHCHITNKIRGVVCANCNYAIGLLESQW